MSLTFFFLFCLAFFSLMNFDGLKVLILFDNMLERLGTILNAFGVEEHIKNYP